MRGVVEKNIDVVGAVIRQNGKILCARRGAKGALAGLWEFPGGKIEAGESAREALQREISEELRCEVAVGEAVTTTRHTYDFAVVTLTTFWCTLLSGSPLLTEHAEVLWASADQLDCLEWAPADIPAVQIIQRYHSDDA